MRTATLLVLLVAVLAGCSSSAPSAPQHVVQSVIAGADFPQPIERAAVEQAVARLNWTFLGADRIPDGFSLNYGTEGEVVIVQSHPTRANWTLSRFYNLTDRTTTYATRDEAGAAANSAWPSFEANFEALVSAFEDAGGWQHVRIRHACLCAER